MFHVLVVCKRELHPAARHKRRHLDEGEAGHIFSDVTRRVHRRSSGAVKGLEDSIGSAEMLHLPEIVECHFYRPAVAVLFSALGRKELIGKVRPALASKAFPVVLNPPDGTDNIMVYNEIKARLVKTPLREFMSQRDGRNITGRRLVWQMDRIQRSKPSYSPGLASVALVVNRRGTPATRRRIAI
jgi:hypothetical protein